MGNGKKSLAKKSPNSMITKNMGGITMENLDPETDISIPRIMLLQPGSDAVMGLGCKPGKFFNKVTSEEVEELLMVSMYLFKQRIYFEEDSSIVCRSQNSVVSSQGLNVGKRCSECKFGKWEKDAKTAKNKPPICRLMNNFLIFTPEDIKQIKAGKFVFPKVISFAKTSYQCSKDIISTALFLGKDLFHFGFTLTSAMRKKDKFTFFVPVIKNHEQMPEAIVKKLEPLVIGMRDLVGHVEIELKDVTDETEDKGKFD